MWPFKPQTSVKVSEAIPLSNTKSFSKPNSVLTIEQLFDGVSSDSAKTLNEAMACVRIKSNAISQCPIIIEQIQRDGTYISALELNNPVMKQLMMTPTNIHTWSGWLSELVFQIELKGNFSTWNDYKGNEPIRFEPFISQGSVAYNYDNSRGVKYATLVTNDSKKLTIDCPDRRLTHFMNSYTSQGIRGLSTLTAAALEMGLLEQSVMLDIINNYDAPTSGFIELPLEVEADQEDVQNFKDNIRDSEGMVVLSNGAKFNSTRLSPVDMALIESKVMNREMICALYGVPVGLITPSTAQSKDDITKFHTLTVAPFIHKIEQTMNSSMPEGWRFRMDDVAFTRGDRQAQIENEATLIQRGLSTLGESADRLGIKCDPERRDLLAIETNNITLGTAKYIQEMQELTNSKLRAEIAQTTQPTKESNSDEKEISNNQA